MNLLFEYRKIFMLIGLIGMMLFTGCKKAAFLEKKPNPKLIVPETLEDYRLLLNNVGVMNGQGIGLCPGLGEASSDNFYVEESLGSQLFREPFAEEIYTWGDGIFSDPTMKPEDWGFPYRCIAYANIVLQGLENMNHYGSQVGEYNRLKGAALFFRAHMYYQLMQIFAPVYDKNLAKEEYGVPLRLDPDISKPSVRAKVEDVYLQIISDLSEAENLLPVIPTVSSQPSKPAVFGLLARVFLSMERYDEALENAKKCLNMNSDLIDYNTLSANNFFPFQRANKEIIFYSVIGGWQMDILNYVVSRADPQLYNSYANNDLRKKLFFMDAASYLGNPNDPGYFFRGSYDGTESLFAGIATDEIYLIRAECYARTGNVSAAMNDLNTLMRNRWNNTVPYPVFTAFDKEEALKQILIERRKELVSRGLRWTDLRRLNKEGANITIVRSHKGKTYTLSPNSLRYTFLIPNEVIDSNPGMPQNLR